MLAPLPFIPTQLPTPTAPPLVGARSLALSPDGSRLAFSYQGDVWVAPAKGGRAVPITNHVEMDDNPIWSPDGQYVAFASNRSGNWDVYVVPSDGGTTRRLTWYSGSDIPSDWSPDGKTILLKGNRDSNLNGIMTLDVATGRTKQVFVDMMPVGSPHYTADGKGIVYTRFGFPWVRPRYEGSAASQLWKYDVSTGTRTPIRKTGLQHLWPNVAPDGRVVCVTVSEKTPSSSPLNRPIPKIVDNVDRTPNVYAIGGSAKRLTDFVGEGARFLTVAAKAPVAAFERDGDVYIMPLGGKPTKVSLTASLDDKTTQEERLVLTSGVTDFSLSPKADALAFVVRGEIWSVPVKKGTGPNANDAEQLTDWAGLDEQPVWTPDGAALFFVSDREGPARLFRMDAKTKEARAISTSGDVADVRLTPDKTKISFWQTGADGGVYTVPVGGGTPTKVLSQPGQNPASYDWSPDGRYVAYLNVLRRSGYYYWDSTSDLFVLDTTTGKSTNVTKLSATHGAPKWSPDGKYIYLRSDRDGDGLYAVALKPEDVVSTELELKYAKPTSPVKVEIEWDGIEDRIRKLSDAQPNGIEVDPQTGDIWYVQNGEIWKTSYAGEDATQVTSGGGAPAATPPGPPRRRGAPSAPAGAGPVAGFVFSADGNQIVFLRGGAMNLMEIRKPGNPVSGVAFRADWMHDLRGERRAAYEQFWRGFNRGFYDPNFHGRDWTALKARYEKFLPSVGHRNEMATVLNMLVGNLESSHSEVGAGPGNPRSEQSAHLGFTYDYGYSGPGIKIKDVPKGTPGSYPKTKLNPGEIVTKINGKPAELGESLYREVLNEQTGREIALTVQGSDGKTREVKYRAISPGAFGDLVFRNLLEARRKHVEERSGGKLTYAHIAGMGEAELRRFNQQVWERAADKQGLIIDVRNNGGGNTSDRIIDVLERQPNSYYQLRDEAPILGPGQALALPMVVMMGETSYSNAEMFPAAMKARNLATLVGMPTPGYVIYTYGFPLIDGTNARMPSTGAFTLGGENLEDNGRQPDVKVDITPEQYLRGEDPQLDAAIDVLMKKVK